MTSKVVAVAAADLHLRDTCPACREPEEFFVAQERKLRFISGLCSEHSCPLLVAGDFFHHWKPSPFLLSLALDVLPKTTIVVPGQHDLIAHNLEELLKTGLQTLASAKRVDILVSGLNRVVAVASTLYTSVYGYGFGEDAREHPKSKKEHVSIMLLHALACEKAQPWVGAGAIKSRSLIKKHKGMDFIVTGDNHIPFAVPAAGTTHPAHINPGSMMRTTSDQRDHRPRVYLLHANRRFTCVYLPITRDVVLQQQRPNSSLHSMDDEKSRTLLMKSFVTHAQTQMERGMSFEFVLKQVLKRSSVPLPVQKMIWEAFSK